MYREIIAVCGKHRRKNRSTQCGVISSTAGYTTQQPLCFKEFMQVLKANPGRRIFIRNI